MPHSAYRKRKDAVPDPLRETAEERCGYNAEPRPVFQSLRHNVSWFRHPLSDKNVFFVYTTYRKRAFGLSPGIRIGYSGRKISDEKICLCSVL